MTVERGVGLVADPFGNRTNDLGFVPDLRVAQVAVRVVLLVARWHVQVELQRVVAQFGDDAFRLIGVRFGFGLVARVTVTVDPHAIAVLAPDELVGRHFQDLAGQVVQGDLDARDCRYHGALDRSLPAHLLDEVFEQAIEIEGVLADDEGQHPFDDLGDAGPPVGLSRPADPGAGIDSHEGPGVVPIDHRGLNVGDFDVATTAAFRRCAHRPGGEFAHRVLGVRVAQRRVSFAIPRRFAHRTLNP